MPCYYPIAAVQERPGGPLTLFKREQKHLYRGMPGRHLEIPCYQCSGCRRRRSLEWAMRCMHEAQLYKYNTYLTLTYADENLPENNSLRHRDYVLFMKALRNRLSREVRNNRSRGEISTSYLYGSHGDSPHTPSKIKFYMAGEYTEPVPEDNYPGGRPHYHALIFGMDFADKIYHGRTKAGEKIYRSPTLETLWTKGYSSLGQVTFASAAYVSRYVMKKRTGDGNLQDYEILDLETGVIELKKKEYNCMSRAPGIGKQWLEKYRADVYTTDKVVTRTGQQLKPPRYYDKQLKKWDAALLEGLKEARAREAAARAADHTTERLAVQEIVANSKARNQTRNLR